MKFLADASAVKADLVKQEITISFKVPLSALEEAQDLRKYVGKDASKVVLTVEPTQPELISEGKED